MITPYVWLVVVMLQPEGRRVDWYRVTGDVPDSPMSRFSERRFVRRT
jgi:hypothetical protein